MSSAAAREPERSQTVKASARVAKLFERHGRMVFGICRAMLRDVHDAEDATQQTFLSAHRALLGGAEIRDAGAWIATIARNECRGRISAGMRQPLPVPRDDLVGVALETDELGQRVQASELVDALARLPERQREAVVLRYVHGLRYGEVAKALGLSRPATEALLFRARRTMRLRLRPIVGVTIAVPVAVRAGLASALPGFEPDPPAATGLGLIGGLLAKFATAPTLAKIGTVSIVATTIGGAGVVQSERASGPPRAPAPEIRSIAPSRSGVAAGIGGAQVTTLLRPIPRLLPRAQGHVARSAPSPLVDAGRSAEALSAEKGDESGSDAAAVRLPEPGSQPLSTVENEGDGASPPLAHERETTSSPGRTEDALSEPPPRFDSGPGVASGDGSVDPDSPSSSSSDAGSSDSGSSDAGSGSSSGSDSSSDAGSNGGSTEGT
jgi:RNA polymerase sigma factor (sigma-70 family)